MEAIYPSMQVLSIFEMPNRPSKYTLHINSRTCALKSNSTHELAMPLSADSLVWNSVIQTHLGNFNYHNAVATYQEMLTRGIRPNRHTLPRILSVSRLSGSLSLGKQLHCHAIKLGVCNDIYVTGTLIELYGHLDSLDSAKSVLHNSNTKSSSCVPWTLLGKLYIKQNKPNLAIDLFKEMLELGGADVDAVSLTTAITACILVKSLRNGVNIHHTARKYGLELDLLVSNSLLKMYMECGAIDNAREVFDKMPSRDAISWTSIIQGYVKNGQINEGLKLFRKMVTEDKIKPDAVAISSILPACGRMAAYKNGKEIHAYLIRNKIPINLNVENALIDMYAKSGNLEYSKTIFSRTKFKDIVSWTVMILGYTLHGQGDVGINLFKKVPRNDTDEISYVTALYACCSARMVEEGIYYFNRINSPTLVHFVLMAALLARSGKLDEARKFVKERGVEKHPEVLRALIDGCRIHKKVTEGKRLVELLCDSEPLNADNYVLMSNWYAENGKREMVEKWRESIKDMDLKPKVAFSWIELRNKVHVFKTGDLSHPRSEGIYWELECLMKNNVEEKGNDFSFHDVDEERECVPIGHSELLAISFGLISTKSGSTIRVTKNLRVCHSCHEAAKYISKVVNREIILKDPNRFHHFKNGVCSCHDFY